MNELCQEEKTVALRSNHSEEAQIIVEDGRNVESSARQNLRAPGDDTTD